MFHLDDITTKDDNKDWPFRKLIIGPSETRKTNYYLIQFKKTTISFSKFICMRKI